MELWQSLQDIPTFWDAGRWALLAGIIITVLGAGIATAMLAKPGDEPLGLCVILVGLVIGLIGGIVSHDSHKEDQYEYVASRVSAYIVETENITPVSGMDIYVESTYDPEEEYVVRTRGMSGMETAMGAKFAAVNSDGEIVDVEMRWLPIEDDDVTKNVDLPKKFNPVTIKITDTSRLGVDEKVEN